MQIFFNFLLIIVNGRGAASYKKFFLKVEDLSFVWINNIVRVCLFTFCLKERIIKLEFHW